MIPTTLGLVFLFALGVFIAGEIRKLYLKLLYRGWLWWL